jgi:hypothetical protein
MVTNDSQKKSVSVTIPQRIKLGETFALSGYLLNSKADVKDIELVIQTRQNGGEWFTVGETMTDLDGRFESNLKAPTNTGIYELRALVPQNKLLIGGEYDAKTIEIYNAPNPAARNLGDTLHTWMPILAVASLGFAMVGFGAYSTKNKDGENE